MRSTYSSGSTERRTRTSGSFWYSFTSCEATAATRAKSRERGAGSSRGWQLAGTAALALRAWRRGRGGGTHLHAHVVVPPGVEHEEGARRTGGRKRAQRRGERRAGEVDVRRRYVDVLVVVKASDARAAAAAEEPRVMRLAMWADDVVLQEVDILVLAVEAAPATQRATWCVTRSASTHRCRRQQQRRLACWHESAGTGTAHGPRESVKMKK